jgi:hypothetical protein
MMISSAICLMVWDAVRTPIFRETFNLRVKTQDGRRRTDLYWLYVHEKVPHEMFDGVLSNDVRSQIHHHYSIATIKKVITFVNAPIHVSEQQLYRVVYTQMWDELDAL